MSFISKVRLCVGKMPYILQLLAAAALLFSFESAFALKSGFKVYRKDNRGRMIRVSNTSWEDYAYVGGSGTYRQVRSDSGQVYYVHRTAVTSNDLRRVSNTRSNQPSGQAISGSSANLKNGFFVRTGPSQKVIGDTNGGEWSLTGKTCSSGWYQVQTRQGTTGCVSPKGVSGQVAVRDQGSSLPPSRPTRPSSGITWYPFNSDGSVNTDSPNRGGETTRSDGSKLTTSPVAKANYRKEMREKCGGARRNSPKKTTKVTHYYVPLLGKSGPRASACHNVEGVCKYKWNGQDFIYNYTGGGRKSQKGFVSHATRNHKLIDNAKCKFGIGYGVDTNCTHPCRSLAASRSHHVPGQVLYFPELVGKSCGTGDSAMIHDGFMVVNDTGAAKHFNHTGRFDFFWGDCKNFSNGVCRDGNAQAFSKALSGGDYCEAWSPRNPLHNDSLKVELNNQMRQEALARGDRSSAASFDLDAFIRGGEMYNKLKR